MTEHLKLDSDSYEIHQYIFNAALDQEPIFDAYKKLCQVQGKINYAYFEQKYYQFYRENYDERSPVTFSDLPMGVLRKKMPEESDPSRIYKFILKAALKEEPIFESYKKLCAIQGNINYVDFEWKYYQFYHENYDDLTVERSPNNSSPRTFSDLPMVVLREVVKELNLVDRLALRKLSRNLRHLVDSTEVHCESMSLLFEETFSTVIVGALNICYRKNDNGGCNVSSFFDGKKMKKYEDDRCFQQVMLADASTFLQNPRLKIGHLVLSVATSEESRDGFEHLQSRCPQLDARSVFILAPGPTVLKMIKFLKPGRLEVITINSECLTVDQLDEVMETEQWKRAVKLCWENGPDGFPWDKLLCFSKIDFFEFKLTDENLIKVRDILLQSAHLESCFLGFDYSDVASEDDEEDVEETDERIHRIMRQNPAFDSETWQFSIPNSRHYFQLELDSDDDTGFQGLRITKFWGT